MTDEKTDQEEQPRSPECPTCGCHKEQFQRLRNFAKAVLAANADTLGTLASAKIALEGDLRGGIPMLVGRSRLHEASKSSSPAPKPIPTKPAAAPKGS